MKVIPTQAPMMEQVDMTDLKSVGCIAVRVRFPMGASFPIDVIGSIVGFDPTCGGSSPSSEVRRIKCM